VEPSGEWVDAHAAGNWACCVCIVPTITELHMANHRDDGNLSIAGRSARGVAGTRLPYEHSIAVSFFSLNAAGTCHADVFYA
jgi:hypothetical protein